jgi:tetratricopeptide (TPR) repeat protein
VFVGGFTLAAAEAVVGEADGVSGGVSNAPGHYGAFRPIHASVRGASAGLDVLGGVEALLDKGLLQHDPKATAEPRFGMLETIREYALERLAAAQAPGAPSALCRRHAAYYLALAEAAAPALTGPQQAAWLEHLEAEHDNLRLALRWALDAGEAETALRIGAALWRFWFLRGHFGEGRQWLGEALAKSTSLATSARAKALNGAGALARTQGDHARAATLLEESLALLRRLGDTAGVAGGLNNLANVACERGDYGTARRLLEESLQLYRTMDDQWAIARVLNNLGVVVRDQGDLERAQELHEECLGLVRTLGDEWLIAASLGNLAGVARERGRYDDAAALCRESLALHRRLGHQRGIAAALTELGKVASAQGDHERTARLLAAADALRVEVGVPLPLDERPSYDAAIAAARAGLGAAAFDAAWARGRAVPLPDAIEFALEMPAAG